MTRGPTRRPARLYKIAEVASMLGWSPWNTRRILRRLAKKDGAAGAWLVRQSARLWLVNLSGLRAAHGELFEASSAPADFELTVEDLRERVAAVEQKQRAHGAAIRALARVLRAV